MADENETPVKAPKKGILAKIWEYKGTTLLGVVLTTLLGKGFFMYDSAIENNMKIENIKADVVKLEKEYKKEIKDLKDDIEKLEKEIDSLDKAQKLEAIEVRKELLANTEKSIKLVMDYFGKAKETALSYIPPKPIVKWKPVEEESSLIFVPVEPKEELNQYLKEISTEQKQLEISKEEIEAIPAK